MARLDTIVARDASSVITAILYDGDTQISGAQTYSIETYAYNKQNDGSIGDLVINMMKYCNSADAYFS